MCLADLNLHQHQILAKNLESAAEGDRTLGERLADRLATFGGSWTFLIVFAAFIALWIVMNSLVLLATRGMEPPVAAPTR